MNYDTYIKLINLEKKITTITVIIKANSNSKNIKKKKKKHFFLFHILKMHHSHPLTSRKHNH